MVFFTCNHCGESLKKPAVEKHYQWKNCRGALPFLTCVDCLKDYKGDEYKEHTKCITEEEKYSAKGFVAKPTKNKGAQKQESWTETLQSLINKPGLDPQVKRSIERIAGQTNVPRKKPKFINFIKNSLRITADNAQKIWNIVEEALEEFKKVTEANNIQKRELEKKTAKTDGEPSLKGVENQQIADGGGDKKLKKKKNPVTNDDNDEAVNVSNGHEGNDVNKKRTKKRTMEVVTEENETEEPPAKIKKKKNKVSTTHETTTSDDTEITNGKSENTPDEQQHTNGNANSNGTEYNWKSEIVKILSKRKSQLTIDKLKNKVVKKYSAHTGKEIGPGVEKKFLKKLKTIPNIAITGECVKLVG